MQHGLADRAEQHAAEEAEPARADHHQRRARRGVHEALARAPPRPPPARGVRRGGPRGCRRCSRRGAARAPPCRRCAARPPRRRWTAPVHVPAVDRDDGLPRRLGAPTGVLERGRAGAASRRCPTTMRRASGSRGSRTTTTGQVAWRARCWLTEPRSASPAARGRGCRPPGSTRTPTARSSSSTTGPVRCSVVTSTTPASASGFAASSSSDDAVEDVALGRRRATDPAEAAPRRRQRPR